MGLGPPVCMKCRVIGELTDNNVRGSSWRCPICKDRNLEASLFTCDISEAELDGNYRLLRFATGKSPTK